MAPTMVKLSPATNQFSFTRAGSQCKLLSRYRLVLIGAGSQPTAKPFWRLFQ
jgi:hypothetical protein